MMEMKITVEAPDLAASILKLAEAIASGPDPSILTPDEPLPVASYPTAPAPAPAPAPAAPVSPAPVTPTQTLSLIHISAPAPSTKTTSSSAVKRKTEEDITNENRCSEHRPRQGH